MSKKDSKVKLKTLEEYVKELGGRGKMFDTLKIVYSDVVTKKIVLLDLNPPKDFVEYLTRADYCMWFWTVLSIEILTILLIILTSVIQGVNYLQYLRYIVGSIYILFLPGYTTIEALYPKEEELSPLERVALSIGLSLAIVPLIGLILNYTPWGIRLTPILIALSIYIIIIGFIATYRKYVEIKKSYMVNTVRS